MNTFYSVVTVWKDCHTDTRDFNTIDEATKEWDFRKRLIAHSPEADTVRILRVSDHRILDITPGREDYDAPSN